ncbi:hypothetical protein [Microbacterium lacus]|uniref:Holin n=1 Tax=Microbacterium lacus TaxID=415217 RepID=A0ABP4RUZ9_9MICO
MDFLLSESTNAVAEQADMWGGEFWAALLSLLTAAVVAFGPGLARKIFPQDNTTAEIAKSSTATVASVLESTLAMVREDVAHVRTKTDENSGKLDALLAIGKGKR